MGRVLLAQRVGEPNSYGSSFACSRSNFRASRFTCRPSEALGYLVYAACYKHVAPLGLNASQFAARYPSWGAVSSPSGLGDPTPTGSRVCDNTTLRSSGARRLDVSRCYRHIAPLERKAGQFAARIPSWGEFSSPSGLGDPTPTDPASLAHVPVFVPPGSPVAPLGLNAAQFAARIPSWGEFSSPMGWGTQPLRIQPSVCDPAHLSILNLLIQTNRTCRPSGAKCGTICGADSIVGRVLLAQWVGEPNPYGSNFACSRSNFRASRFTCRPSGALGIWCIARAINLSPLWG